LLHQYSDCGGVFCSLFTTTTVKRVRFGKRSGNFLFSLSAPYNNPAVWFAKDFWKWAQKKQQTFFKIYCLYAAVMGGDIKLSAVKAELQQTFYQPPDDMLLHIRVDLTVHFRTRSDISGIMG
jgi:hypothetical protein